MRFLKKEEEEKWIGWSTCTYLEPIRRRGCVHSWWGRRESEQEGFKERL